MQYVYAFLVGGVLCVAAQVLIDKTGLTPARILVIYVTAGVVLTAAGLYEPLVDFAGAGATVPLTGCGYSLAKGVEESIARDGYIGILSGGLSACSAGIAAAIFFAGVMTVFRRPRAKGCYGVYNSVNEIMCIAAGISRSRTARGFRMCQKSPAVSGA